MVFCLYAESSGIFFGKHKIFRDWLEGARNIRWDLIHLFDVLNTPIDERDPYLDDTLKKFPYVNGGLFSGKIEIPNFTLYHFKILTSSIHMAWLRTVGGRLKSDYLYSKDVVYNNFVWIEPTETQRLAVEQFAQNILDARKNYPKSTLAALYDEVSMPYELRKAHRENDLAVAKAYGWEKFLDDEPTLAVKLLKLYEQHASK